MGRWRQALVPLTVTVTAAGLVVALGGFAYDVAFAGIPYHDPTPEMQARWRYHSDVAGDVMLAGVALASLGVFGLFLIGGVAVWASRRQSSRR